MIYRIDVRPAAMPRDADESASDPLGESIRHQIAEFGSDVGSVSTSRVYLLDADASREQMQRAARDLLADPIVETAELIDPNNPPRDIGSRVEIHLKPGVMD